VKHLLIIFILLLVSGCSTKQVLPTPNKAFLEGHDSFHLFGVSTTVMFKELDGNKLGDYWKGYPFQLNVEPGQHEVKVRCSSIQSKYNTSAERSFNLFFEADKKYTFSMLIHPKNLCSINVKEQQS